MNARITIVAELLVENKDDAEVVAKTLWVSGQKALGPSRIVSLKQLSAVITEEVKYVEQN
jgi:hypothetical protein